MKRRKNSRRTVRCTLCTKHRWKGNRKDRLKPKDNAKIQHAKRECREQVSGG